MNYSIEIYSKIKNSVLIDKYDNDECVSNISYDGDKMIEDDFFAFEAKRLKLEFYLTGSALGTKIKEVVDSGEFLIREYPQYKDQSIVVPSEQTNYLDFRFKFYISGNLVFDGFPDFNSFSEDLKTGQCSLEFISLYGIFFDNINNLKDLRIFNSYMIDYLIATNGSYSADKNIVYQPYIFLNQFIKFFVDNGIEVDLPILSDIGADTALVINTPAPIYNNSEEITKNYFEYADQYFGQIEYGLIISYPKNNVMSIKYYEMTFKEQMPIKCLFRAGGNGHEGYYFTIQILKPFGIARLTEIKIDISSKKVLKVSTPKIVTTLDNDDFYFNYRTYSGNKTYIEIEEDYTKNWTEENALEFLNSLPEEFVGVSKYISDLEYPQNGLIVYTSKKRVDVYGSINPSLSFDIDFKKNTNESYLDYKQTDGLFNPEKFSSADLFKHLLILSGGYLVPNPAGSSMRIINRNELFSDTMTELNKSQIITLNRKQTILDIIKMFDEADYSETDNHWFIRLLVFEYKYLLTSLQKVYSANIIKDDSSQYELGKRLNLNLEGNVFNFFINAVEEQEDTVNLELIKIS